MDHVYQEYCGLSSRMVRCLQFEAKAYRDGFTRPNLESSKCIIFFLLREMEFIVMIQFSATQLYAAIYM